MSSSTNGFDNLLKACNFAAKKHKDQRRKDATKSPYINHPLQVAGLLAECGVNDVNTLQAAVLHDTIEDTKTTSEELTEHFGSIVSKIVGECSDDKKLDKVTRKRLQIEHAKHACNEAKLVKLADKYSNLHDLLTNPPADWSKAIINGYFMWSYLVVEAAKGVNSKLDEKLQQVFASYAFDKLTVEERNNRVEEYYKLIQNKE